MNGTWMDRALGLFNEPADVYEYPTLEFLAGNPAADEWREQIPDREGPPRYKWTGLTAPEIHELIDNDPDHHFRLDTEYGMIHATLVPQLNEHIPRPDLLLASAHPYGDKRQARVAHIQMRLVMLTSELEETSALLLEAASAQVMAVRDTLATTLVLRREQLHMTMREILE